MSTVTNVIGNFGSVSNYGNVIFDLEFITNGNNKVTSITGTMIYSGDGGPTPSTNFTIIGEGQFESNDNIFYPNPTLYFFNEGSGIAFTDTDKDIKYSFINDGSYFVNYQISDSSIQNLNLIIAEACILRGMKILTTKGEIKVEDLTLDNEIISGNGKIYKIKKILNLPYKGFESNPCEVILDGKIVYLSKDHSIKYKGEWLSPYQRGLKQISNNKMKKLINFKHLKDGLIKAVYYHIELYSKESRRDIPIIVNGIEIEPFSMEKLI